MKEQLREHKQFAVGGTRAEIPNLENAIYNLEQGYAINAPGKMYEVNINAKPEHIRRVDSLASAVHSILERVEILTPEGPAQALVLATNVYHKTPQGWRMVVHHTSPGTVGEADALQHAPQTLH